MAININAKTSGVGGLETTADNSGNINIQSGGSTVMSVTSSGVAVTGSFSQNGAVYSTQPSFRNLIINGDMRIDQRNAGSEINPVANNTYSVDRWNLRSGTTSLFKFQQNAGSVTPPEDFTNYLGITSLSSHTVGTTEISDIRQGIEGQNIAHLKWGTADAKTVTVSFWVRSSLTGTFGASLSNTSANRCYPFSYSITSANTWEKKTITIDGDTTGTWSTDNTIGIRITFSLGTGTTYLGTSGAWVSSLHLSVTGETPIVGTSGATFYITGVQLEVGSTATEFEHLPYDVELARCQRYYEKSFNIETAPADNVYTQAYLANVPYIDQWVLCAPYIPFKVEKRVTPTVVYYGSSGKWQVNNTSNSWVTFSTVYSTGQGSSGINTKGMSVTVHNGGNSGYSVSSARTIRGDWTASAEL